MDSSSWSGGSTSSDHDLNLFGEDLKFVNNDSHGTHLSAEEDYYNGTALEPLEIDLEGFSSEFVKEPAAARTIRDSNNSDNQNAGREFECILYHKPRGCKGIWTQVEKHSAIRVTKGKGKWLKLDVRSQHSFRQSDVDVFLADISGAHSAQQIIEQRLAHNRNEGFTIGPTVERAPAETGGFHLLEIELKLDRVCKRLQFWAVLKMSGRVLIGRSVEFSAHNNGKTRVDSDHTASPASSEEYSSPGEQMITLSELPSSLPNHTSVATQRNNDHPAEASRNGSNAAPQRRTTNDKARARPAPQMAPQAHHPTATPMGSNSTTISTLLASVQHGQQQQAAQIPMHNQYQQHHQQQQQQQQQQQVKVPPNAQNQGKMGGFEMQNGPSMYSNYELHSIADDRSFQMQGSGSSPGYMSSPNDYNEMENQRQAMMQQQFHQNNKPHSVYIQPNAHGGFDDYEMTDIKMYGNGGNQQGQTFNPNKRKQIISSPESGAEYNANGYYSPDSTTTLPGSLKVNGVVKAHAFIQFSDLRLKANLQELTDAVNIISQLEGRSYTWKNDVGIGHETGGRRVIGLIAQQVQKVVPEIVYEDKETGLLSVSYAEIVPILIEAFKQQSTENQARQEGVDKELAELRHKLEAIDQNMFDDEDVEPNSKFGKFLWRLKHKITPDTLPKLIGMRFGTIIIFIIGLLMLVFGSITLGMLLFAADQTLHTEILGASGLKQMDASGAADPYVEVDIGADVYQTATRWNTTQPVWGQTFSLPLDPSTVELTYVVFDQDNNPDYGPRRMGTVVIPIANLTSGELLDRWFPLQPSSPGDNTSGQLHVTVLLLDRKPPGYEVSLITIGVVFLVLSLVWGSFVWCRSSKIRRPRRRNTINKGSRV